MPEPRVTSLPAKVLTVLVSLCLIAPGVQLLSAGEVRLKNGTVIPGRPVPLQGMTTNTRPRDREEIRVYPILMVEDQGLRRTFVAARQVADVNQDIELNKHEVFTLSQRKMGGRGQMINTLGAIQEITPFDEFGRRRTTLSVGGKELAVFQGITEITPEYAKVTGLNYQWEFGIPTNSLPPETLDTLLRRASNPDDANERLGIARFYLQAGLYFRAEEELAAIRLDFPDLSKVVDGVQLELRQLQAQQFVDELKIRRAAGQFQLTYDRAKKFPVTDISGSILREVRELILDHEKELAQIEQTKQLLGELQAQLPIERAAEIAPVRLEICEKLDFNTMDRLAAFYNLAMDGALEPDEKLALAVSGWVLGSTNAVRELDTAMRLWNARFLIRQYLRTDSPREREELLATLQQMEDVGVAQIAKMIPQLPPPLESPSIQGGTAVSFEFTPAVGEPPIRYAALPPTEYRSSRSYPLIVTLRPEGRTIEEALQWWGGTSAEPGHSQRNGYVVIAPEYAPAEQRKYDYGTQAHRVVLQALLDARKRFNIDSDRIYLSGHGMGADAAFDIGFSHPDYFAGVIPISGVSDKYCKYYWKNADKLPLYVINGELDREAVAANIPELTNMFRFGYDVIYVEHVGHGRDHFFSEIADLFEWMPRHRRLKAPPEIQNWTLRPTDNRFWWWEINDLPASNMLADIPEEKARIVPLRVSGKKGQTNAIILTCGAGRHTLRLSPELIDFNERLTVRLNNSQKWNDFVTPNLTAMLEDFRIRGDRQNLVWARLDF